MATRIKETNHSNIEDLERNLRVSGEEKQQPQAQPLVSSHPFPPILPTPPAHSAWDLKSVAEGPSPHSFKNN